MLNIDTPSPFFQRALKSSPIATLSPRRLVSKSVKKRLWRPCLETMKPEESEKFTVLRRLFTNSFTLSWSFMVSTLVPDRQPTCFHYPDFKEAILAVSNNKGHKYNLKDASSVDESPNAVSYRLPHYAESPFLNSKLAFCVFPRQILSLCFIFFFRSLARVRNSAVLRSDSLWSQHFSMLFLRDQ